MKKILFDSSIHLGQFSVTDEVLRIACKNMQVRISAKPNDDVVGVITFEENSWADHLVWTLDRETQDRFFQFMDLFHSAKQILRVPLSVEHAQRANKFAVQFNLHIANALTCAVSVTQGAQEIHTYYPTLLQDDVTKFMRDQHNVIVRTPEHGSELVYAEGDLEERYQHALRLLRQRNASLTKELHD